MSFTLALRPEVAEDLKHGATWYDSCRLGLGADFMEECQRTLDRVRDHPERWACDRRGVRTALLHRFPYLVHYRIEGHLVVVFALTFGGRDPALWQKRL